MNKYVFQVTTVNNGDYHRIVQADSIQAIKDDIKENKWFVFPTKEGEIYVQKAHVVDIYIKEVKDNA